MLYTGERNFGCRFLEVSLFGLRTLILENEKIRIMMLLDKGLEIIEFSYKETDTDFVWRSPQGLSNLRQTQLSQKDSQYLTDNYTGGWFEVFPSLSGEQVNFRGAQLHTYGEVCYLPWEYSVLVDKPEEVSLKCFVRTVKTPFWLEKKFTVKSNISSLFIEESITNLGFEALEYEWGYHLNIGSPFLDENCLIDLPGGELNVHESIKNSRVELGSKGVWPFLAGKNGRNVDFSRMMPKGEGVMDLVYLSDIKEGWVVVRNTVKRIGIGLSWDKSVFGNCMLWIVSNGDEGYPRYGNTYVYCIFPRNIEGVASIGRENPNAPNIIKGGETVSTWFTVTPFKTQEKVESVEVRGED